jgi:hypothetical protein
MAEANVWFRHGHVLYNSQSTRPNMKNVVASGRIYQNSQPKPVMKNWEVRSCHVQFRVVYRDKEKSFADTDTVGISKFMPQPITRPRLNRSINISSMPRIYYSFTVLDHGLLATRSVFGYSGIG